MKASRQQHAAGLSATRVRTRRDAEALAGMGAEVPLARIGQRAVTAVVWGWILALAVVHLERNLGHALDDSYITFRYALNLAQGHGLAFNVGEIHYGSTAMGFAIFLGAVAAAVAHTSALLGGVTPPPIVIPHLATVLSTASLVAIAFVFDACARRLGSSLARLLVLVFPITALFVGDVGNANSGHETYPFVALIFIGVYLAMVSRKGVAAGLTLAIATMFRPDSLLFAGTLVGLLVAFAARQADRAAATRLVTRLAAAYGIPMLAWTAWTWSHFGSPVPATMAAKKAQVAIGYWPLFSIERVSGDLLAFAPPEVLALLAVGLGCHLLQRIRRDGTDVRADARIAQVALFWIVSSIALVAAYLSFRVTFWDRYLTPIHFALLFLAVPATGAIAWAIARLRSTAARAAVLALGLVAIGALWGPEYTSRLELFATTKNHDEHLESYDPIVRFLHEQEPGGTSVATPEPGAFGYRLGAAYYVVDEFGLTTPGVAHAISLGDFDYAFRRYEPEYVIVSWNGRQNPLGREWFERSYGHVAEFPHPYWKARLGRGAHLYKRRDDATRRSDR